MNRSKMADPRFWKKWYQSGAVNSPKYHRAKEDFRVVRIYLRNLRSLDYMITMASDIGGRIKAVVECGFFTWAELESSPQEIDAMVAATYVAELKRWVVGLREMRFSSIERASRTAAEIKDAVIQGVVPWRELGTTPQELDRYVALKEEQYSTFMRELNLQAIKLSRRAEKPSRRPQWFTQGGGLAEEAGRSGIYVFVEKPNCSSLDVGDVVPAEWGLTPANNSALDMCFEDNFAEEHV